MNINNYNIYNKKKYKSKLKKKIQKTEYFLKTKQKNIFQ